MWFVEQKWSLKMHEWSFVCCHPQQRHEWVCMLSQCQPRGHNWWVLELEGTCLWGSLEPTPGFTGDSSSKSKRGRCLVIEPGLALGPGLLVLSFPAPLHGLSGWLSLYETCGVSAGLCPGWEGICVALTVLAQS